jgi:hypothetical protein
MTPLLRRLTPGRVRPAVQSIGRAWSSSPPVQQQGSDGDKEGKEEEYELPSHWESMEKRVSMNRSRGPNAAPKVQKVPRKTDEDFWLEAGMYKNVPKKKSWDEEDDWGEVLTNEAAARATANIAPAAPAALPARATISDALVSRKSIVAIDRGDKDKFIETFQNVCRPVFAQVR